MMIEARQERQVLPGEVWSAGGHVLTVGDLYDGVAEGLMKQHGIPAGAYIAGISAARLIEPGLDASLDIDGNVFIEVHAAIAATVRDAIQARGGTVVNTWHFLWSPADEEPDGQLLRVRWRTLPTERLPYYLTAGPTRQRPALWALSNFQDAGDVVLCLFNSLSVISAEKARARALSIDFNLERMGHALRTLEGYRLPVTRQGVIVTDDE